MRIARSIGWIGAGALVVLASRSLAYAFAPHPGIVAGRLEAEVGGARLVVLAVVAPADALALAAVAVWLASVAVRERRALEPRAVGMQPIRLVRIAVGTAPCASCVFSLAYSPFGSNTIWPMRSGSRCQRSSKIALSITLVVFDFPVRVMPKSADF